MTPNEYRGLRVWEHRAMIEILKDMAKERRKSLSKGRR